MSKEVVDRKRRRTKAARARRSDGAGQINCLFACGREKERETGGGTKGREGIYGVGGREVVGREKQDFAFCKGQRQGNRVKEAGTRQTRPAFFHRSSLVTGRAVRPRSKRSQIGSGVIARWDWDGDGALGRGLAQRRWCIVDENLARLDDIDYCRPRLCTCSWPGDETGLS